MQLELKTLLNAVQHFPGFVYVDIRLVRKRSRPAIEVRVKPRAGVPARCCYCHKPCPGYDHLPERAWQFIPVWVFLVWFLYAPRRVQCPEHGVVVEAIPWSEGKRPVTLAMIGFLSRWAA